MSQAEAEALDGESLEGLRETFAMLESFAQAMADVIEADSPSTNVLCASGLLAVRVLADRFLKLPMQESLLEQVVPRYDQIKQQANYILDVAAARGFGHPYAALVAIQRIAQSFAEASLRAPPDKAKGLIEA